MKIIIALGGNALGTTPCAQLAAIKHTSAIIADLIKEGHSVVLTHGNGPQVGMIAGAMGADPRLAVMPMSLCVAMSQGYTGFDLQSILRAELRVKGIEKEVATIITQVVVSDEDPAFGNPTKPIGSFMSEEEAELLRKKGVPVAEDSGRGFRRVVASPAPLEIVELETVKTLLDAGQVVIACGGGGIPVIKKGKYYDDADAVIDKDRASSLLARQLGAERLVILTAVEKIAINFNTPRQKWLSHISATQAKKYIEEGHFAPGSMLPKVTAAIEFAESGHGRRALITHLDKARDGIDGKTGTVIEM